MYHVFQQNQNREYMEHIFINSLQLDTNNKNYYYSYTFHNIHNKEIIIGMYIF